MRQHGKVRSSLLSSVTAVTVTDDHCNFPQGTKREGSHMAQPQGCKSCTHGDADVVCVQCRAQTECQRFTALRDRCFSKPEAGKELSKRAKRVPEMKAVQ